MGCKKVFCAIFGILLTACFTPGSTNNETRCSNASYAKKCLEDFAANYRWNMSLAGQDRIQQIACSQVQPGCVKSVYTNTNCSSVKEASNNNDTELQFALFCTETGLKVIAKTEEQCTNTSFMKDLEDNMELFCGFNSSLKCSNATGSLTVLPQVALKPLYDNCFSPKPAPTDIPLLLNPVSPEAITAIVVIVCLAIIVILAGFFFWPKCHNPKAGWFPKKRPPRSNEVAYAVSDENSKVQSTRGVSKA